MDKWYLYLDDGIEGPAFVDRIPNHTIYPELEVEVVRKYEYDKVKKDLDKLREKVKSWKMLMGSLS